MKMKGIKLIHSAYFLPVLLLVVSASILAYAVVSNDTITNTVTITSPLQFQVTAVSTTPSSTCSLTAGTWGCTTVSLAPGGTVTYSMTVQNTGTNPGSVTATPTISCTNTGDLTGAPTSSGTIAASGSANINEVLTASLSSPNDSCTVSIVVA